MRSSIRMASMIFLAAALLLGYGCSDSEKPLLLINNPNPQELATGSLRLNLKSTDLAVAAKMSTITSGGDMTIATYDIVGVGPGGASINMPGVVGDSVDIRNIAVGSWAFSITGRNTGGQGIGRGTVNVMVQPGIVTAAQVTVRPLTGTGTLLASISWPASLISDPSVVATLSSGSGTPVELVFAIAGDGLSASYTNAALDAGYYTMSLKLKSGGLEVWGTVQAIRITADENTTASFPLTAETINMGTINIQIVQEMENPVGVTLSGSLSSIMAGSTMTVTAIPSTTVDSYQWYLDGTALAGETASSVTVGDGLSGTHRLDVIVTKGNTLGAAGMTFTVLSVDKMRVILRSGMNGNSVMEHETTRAINGSSINSVTYSGAGPDGIWGNEDDVMQGYMKILPSQGILAPLHNTVDPAIDIYDSMPRVGTMIAYSNPGPDGQWFSSDDVESTYYVITQANDNGQTISRLCPYNAGPDGILHTADDVFSSYEVNGYDARGRIILRKMNGQVGPDGQRFTADDTFMTMQTITRDANGRIMRIDTTRDFGGVSSSNYALFLYSANGMLERINLYNDSNVLINYTMKSHDDKNRMIRSRLYDANGALINDSEFLYL